MDPDAVPIADRIAAIYRDEGRFAFATLVRLLGDFDRAEEALHDAFREALERWPIDGVPGNPRAWLVSAGRFRGIDGMRKHKRLQALDDRCEEPVAAPQPTGDDTMLADDHLRLIFTCCHPSLAAEACIALTLREVCGLSTEEIARAFLVPAPTLAQRIVRAKNKIRAAGIPFEVPEASELPPRLRNVLHVVYLVFNEGYTASAGERLIRHDLCEEALRVARLLHERLPEPEVEGLLALLLLQQSRAAARVDSDGDLVPLDEQDRSRWDRARIVEGTLLAERALASGRTGPYAVQAAIAALHAEAATPDATDWPQIAGLYEVLRRLQPSPVVELNFAVAVAMRDGPAAGLRRVEALLQDERMARYHLAHAACADLRRRLGDRPGAREAYEQALQLATLAPERRFLQRRLRELADG